MKQVFEKLKEKGLTLNREKCKFRRQEVVFMEFRISGTRYQPLQSKVEAVQRFRIPKTVEEIGNFLGLTFMPHLLLIWRLKVNHYLD